jgi:hypothetical protein
MAPPPKQTVGAFDYLGYLQRAGNRSSAILVRAVEGASHAFAEGLGRETVRQHIEEWLDDHFPLSRNGNMQADRRSRASNPLASELHTPLATNG